LVPPAGAVGPFAEDVLERAVAIAGAVGAEKASDFVAAAAPAVEELEAAGSAPSGTASAMRLAARLSDARSEDDMKRLARDLVVPLPPWTDPLLLDANASLPVLESEEVKLNGDVTLGYNGGSWGLVTRGSAFDYELTTKGGLTDTIRYDGEASGWGYVRIAPELRGEIRGLLGVSFYDTTSVSAKASSLFVDETSFMGRGEALVGLRWDASDTLAFSVQAGAGLQSESWDGNSLSTVSGAKVVYVDESRTPTTFRAEGRVRAEWRALPDVLAVRLRADLDNLAVSRSDTTNTTIVGGGSGVSTTTGTSVTSTRQTEIFTRLFFDIDALRVLELRPALHAGFNYVEVSSSNASAKVVPVFGLGMRREAF
jgi:hypothetical protein